MAKQSFPVPRNLGPIVVRVLISIGVGIVCHRGAQAEPQFHCPAGQMYRVSKKICVPKESRPRSSPSGQISEDLPHPSPRRLPVVGPANINISPPISSLDGTSEVSRAPKVEKAETPRVAEPELFTSPASEFVSKPDAVVQARLPRKSETSWLEDSVALYREALKEQIRDRAPLEWAAMQNNLANALFALGEGESGTSRLEEAVALYREALKQHTREHAPLEWATIQNNLSRALAALAERESGTARLAEAVAVKREVRGWAIRTGNQGVALMQLAEHSGNSDMARTALRQIDMAFIAIRDGDHGPLFAGYFKEQLPRARALVERLGER